MRARISSKTCKVAASVTGSALDYYFWPLTNIILLS